MKGCSHACMYNSLSGCVVEKYNGICPLSNMPKPDVPVTNVVKTNADHIRSMTDEELAEFMCDATYKENEQGYPIMRTVNKVWWRKWIKQPYKEES